MKNGTANNENESFDVNVAWIRNEIGIVPSIRTTVNAEIAKEIAIGIFINRHRINTIVRIPMAPNIISHPLFSLQKHLISPLQKFL